MPLPSYTLYTPPGSFRALAPLIAAECNGIEVEVVTENIQEILTHKSPTGQAPILECSYPHQDQSPEIIFGCSAIARYLAGLRSDTGLLGVPNSARGLWETRACVDQWVDWCQAELEIPVCVLFYPQVGLMTLNETATQKAKQDTKQALKVLQNQLQDQSYIVGDAFTLADIVVVATLVYPFRLGLLDAEFLKPLQKVVEWYQRCRSLPEIETVLGPLDTEKETNLVQTD